MSCARFLYLPSFSSMLCLQIGRVNSCLFLDDDPEDPEDGSVEYQC